MSKILHRRQDKGAAINRGATETTGEVFADGTVLELVCRDCGTGETSLLRWDENGAVMGQHFEINGQLYLPSQLNSAFLRALRLPAHLSPYGSTRDLFADICKVFVHYTDLAESHVRQIAHFILGDWLADRLSVAPFLFITAPLGTPRAQLLRLLSSLCRRPLMLAEVTPAVLSSFASLKPTLLLDEPNLSGRIVRLLYATNIHGRFVLRKERVVDAFCAKVICSQEPLCDAPLAGQALQITLSPAGRDVPFLADSLCERITDEFQSKLLHYRLTNLGKIRIPPIDVSQLTAPMQDLARSLASCVADDEELQHGVVRLLRERDQGVHLNLSTELRSVVLEALLFCCHCEGRSHVLAGELADIVNTIWERRAAGRHATPESVGWKLRTLDLRTEPIDGAGHGLRLSEAVRARIHGLARGYRVPLRPTAQEGCPHCKAAGAKQ